jgi:hypothetical protein
MYINGEMWHVSFVTYLWISHDKNTDINITMTILFSPLRQNAGCNEA